ncbi:MAG: right-handed parallel beta-helix repeat-containing protein [Chitinophagaceae bacterium]
MTKHFFYCILIVAVFFYSSMGMETAMAERHSTDGTTYYVSPDGNDSNAGTDSAAPWQSLAKVNSMTFAPGDRLLLQSGGVWNDTLCPKGSGKEGLPIVIDKYGGEHKPRINGGGKVNGSSALSLNKVAYWEVNNLEITNAVPAGVTYVAIGIKVNGGVRSEDSSYGNITIRNCYVHDVDAATAHQPNYHKGSGGIILVGKLSDVLVQGCHIANCSVEGLRSTGFAEMERRSKNIVFDHNLIENIYGDGIVMAQVSGGSRITHNTVRNACMTNDINFAGIWTVGSRNTLVAYNEVYGMKGGGPHDGMAFDADGWDNPSATDGDIFEYNYSHDNNGGFFLLMSHSDNITVRYNVSVNDVGKTGRKKLFLIEDSPKTNRYVYNNVFYIVNPVGQLFWKGVGAVFSNNIFYVVSGVNKLSDMIPDSKAKFYNNCFYPQSTFESLNWGTAVRNNNFYDEPQFVRPVSDTGLAAALGFDVQSASPCRNAGIFVPGNGSVDFLGNMLPNGKPDVGAFQHKAVSEAESSLGK